MSFIDMHIHTVYGNSKYCSLEQLLSMATENGVKVISFTDHNTLKAYFELMKKYSSEEIERIYGVKIVVGVEVNCKIGNQFNDMLVYNIDNLTEFQNWLDANTNLDKSLVSQQEQLEFYKQVCQNLGLKFDDEDLVLSDKCLWAGTVISAALNKYYDENYHIIPDEDLKDGTLFFIHQCCNQSSPFFFNISKYRPKVEDLISKAHECGGLVFVAHPGAYNGASAEDLQQYLSFAKSLGVDGVEIDNSFNQNVNMYRTVPVKFCIDNNLKMSAGTDIHTIDDSDFTRCTPGVAPRYSGVGVTKPNSYVAKKFRKEIIDSWAKYWYFTKELKSIIPSTEYFK